MGNRCEQGLHSSYTAVGHRGSPRGSPGVTGAPGGHRRRSSVDVPMCSYGQGLIRAASGTTLGVLGTSKMKENKRFYGFTDFRGKPEKRGRGRRATANQVTAGKGDLVARSAPGLRDEGASRWHQATVPSAQLEGCSRWGAVPASGGFVSRRRSAM